MTDVAERHPDRDPGLGGLRIWIGTLCLALACFALGLAVTYSNPVMVLGALGALVAGALFVWLCVAHPLLTLCLVVAAQILMPVYIRLPLGVPPPLLMLALLVAVSAAQRMLNPVPSRPGKYEHLIATTLIIYNLLLLITIPNEHASSASYMMLIKTVIIPTSLFFVMLATVRTPQQLAMVFRTITIAAVACGLLGIQEFTIKHNYLAAWLAPPVTIDEDFFLWLLANSDQADAYLGGSIYRVYSFFTQPLEYSAFMTMAFPFAALAFVTAETSFRRIMYGLATVVILAGFVVSFSRGPTLALALVILTMGVFERRVRPWILGGTVALMGALIAFWPFIWDKIGERVTGSKNVTLRFRLWENGLSIFQQNPLRGIGYGSYPNYHAQSIRDNQIGPLYEYHWSHIEKVNTVENIFISLAAETGIVGLSGFALVLLTAFYVFRQVYRRCEDPLVRLLALSAFGAILAYLLSGMTVANIIGYTISILFFGVYIAALAILSRQLPEGARPLLLMARRATTSVSRGGAG